MFIHETVNANVVYEACSAKEILKNFLHSCNNFTKSIKVGKTICIYVTATSNLVNILLTSLETTAIQILSPVKTATLS